MCRINLNQTPCWFGSLLCLMPDQTIPSLQESNMGWFDFELWWATWDGSHDFGKSHLLLGETSQRSGCSFDILWLNGPPKKTHRHAPRGERHLWSTLDLAQGWHWLIHLESINRIQWISMAWCKFDEKPSSNTDFTAKKVLQPILG